MSTQLKKEVSKWKDKYREAEEKIEELKQNLEERDETIKRLRKEIAEIIKDEKSLKERVERLENKEKKPYFVKKNRKKKQEKSGRKKGHKGHSRKKPRKIDRVEELDIDNCPHCNNNLSEVQEVRERIVIEIPRVKAETVKYKINRRYCSNCEEIVEPEVNALPNSQFGLNLMLMIMFFKVGLLMPTNKIVDLLNIQYGLEISEGEIHNILYQLSEGFGDYYEWIVKKIKEARVKYCDETGWRNNGINQWLWTFINESVALFRIEDSRGSKVPIEVLGNQEGNIVVSDRWPAYNQLSKNMGCKQQICWAHLLRNSEDLAEHYNEAGYIHKRLKTIFNKAKDGEDKEKILHWIDLIAKKQYKSHEVNKFVKSVCEKHREDLFRFVDNPHVEPTNNRSERGLRHGVVMRKISYGSRSDKGAKTTARLLSIYKTMKLQNLNPVEDGLKILQKRK